MASQYHSLFTDQGLVLLREAIQTGAKLGITHMSYGDGNGVLPVPDASFTKMVKEVYRTQLNRLAPSKENPNWLEADGVIPSAVGGFNIREVGLWAGNVMVAYANYPPTYKPSADQGTAQIKTIRIVLQIDNTANFELKIDASVVMATVQIVEDAKNELYGNTVGQVESIADLIATKSRIDGQIVYVKSYHLGLNKGGGLFIYDSSLAGISNNITIFNGYIRVDFDNPSVYQSGIIGNESDCYVKLQALTNISVGKKINLEGLHLNFSQLDIPSDTYFYNGTMNCTASVWQNTYGRTPIMLKNTDRNNVGVDYEAKASYEAIIETKNITFENIHFIAKDKIALFFKFDGLSLLNCSGEWEKLDLFKFVGGINGTVLVTDTPTSYTLIDPINGRNKNIFISNFTSKGGYVDSSFSSPFHFVGCENVTIKNGNYDSPLGIKIDIYNKNFELNNFTYVNTNKQLITEAIAGTGDPDMYAIYIGQQSYDIRINGGVLRNFAKKAIYIEAASQVVIDSVHATCEDDDSVARFVDLQANYRDNDNNYWGNVADITIKNCIANGVRYGIGTSPFNNVKSIKNIKLIGNIINTNNVFDAVAITGTESYFIENCVCNGNLTLNSNNGENCYIKNSSFKNKSNYALYVGRQNDGVLPNILNTDFIVNSGPAIYNNGGNTRSCNIVGGNIKAGDGSSLMELGNAADINCFDFNNDLIQRMKGFQQTINLAAGETSPTIKKSIPGVREGWIPNLTMHGIVYLDYNLIISVSAEVDAISFKIKNNGTSTANFSANMILKLNSFCNQVFTN